MQRAVGGPERIARDARARGDVGHGDELTGGGARDFEAHRAALRAGGVARGGGPGRVAEGARLVVEPDHVTALEIGEQRAAGGEGHQAHAELAGAPGQRDGVGGARVAGGVDGERDDGGGIGGADAGEEGAPGRALAGVEADADRRGDDGTEALHGAARVQGRDAEGARGELEREAALGAADEDGGVGTGGRCQGRREVGPHPPARAAGDPPAGLDAHGAAAIGGDLGVGEGGAGALGHGEAGEAVRVDVDEGGAGERDPFAAGGEGSPGDGRAVGGEGRRLVARGRLGARRGAQRGAVQVVGAVAGPGDQARIGARLAEGAAWIVGEDALEGGEIGGVERAREAIGGHRAGGGGRGEDPSRRVDGERLALGLAVEVEEDRGRVGAREARRAVVLELAVLEIGVEDRDAAGEVEAAVGA